MLIRRRFTILILIFSAIVFKLTATPSAVVPVSYQVTDLGTLNGDSCSGNVGRSPARTSCRGGWCGDGITFAYGINDAGLVVGQFETPEQIDGFHHGFVKDGTTYTRIDVPGATDTYASGINNAGQIVGRNFINDSGGTGGVAVMWSSATPTRLDTVIGGDFSSALDINNLGQIVGLRGYLPDISSWSAFQYDSVSGHVTALPGLGGTFRSVATSINDFGIAAGYATTLLNANHAVRAPPPDDIARRTPDNCDGGNLPASDR